MSNERPPLLIAHPWHGVPLGDDAPARLTCYIECVPTDTVKYELDKATGILRVDRPQKFSNVPPSLYGFIPRSYCAEQVAARCMERTHRSGIVGDGDPMDVCVLSERPVAHGGLLVTARPIGGFRMIDKGQADDKIIAVLNGDAVWGGITDIAGLSKAMRMRLEHYFVTYKLDPETTTNVVEIAEVYDKKEALFMIEASRADYAKHFGNE